MTIQERINKKFIIEPKTNCHIWIGNIDRSGCPLISIKNNKKSVARFLYESINNKKLSRDMYVLKRCNNPKCINIDHLFEATRSEHQLIYSFKKLTKDQIKEILQRYIAGWNKLELGKEFNVSDKAILKIIRKHNSIKKDSNNNITDDESMNQLIKFLDEELS